MENSNTIGITSHDRAGSIVGEGAASQSDRRVGIIGLGYVGLTLATVLADVGFRVFGIEKRREVVDATNAGRPHFSEMGLAETLSRVVSGGQLTAAEAFSPDMACDVYIITVGTPLGADGAARLDMIEAATRQVAGHMREGALVILRSTVKIGTARLTVAPILAATGKGFSIAMCPERTLEGNALHELRELPQIVGADDQPTRDRASALFRNLTNSIVQVSGLESAELVKLVDNTFRDVQFGFANEVARICDAFGINAHEVISAGKLGYKRTNVPLPGPVGGPCLEKDPHILAQSARERGIELDIAPAARKVNERQPGETAGFIIDEMDRRSLPPDSRVAVLGLAFKGVPATDDLRGSMSLKIIAELCAARPTLQFGLFDPVIAPDELALSLPQHQVHRSLEDAVAGAALVVICNNHPALAASSPRSISQHMVPGGFIYDYWNNFSNLQAQEVQGIYGAVGNRVAVSR
jgi:UDP-N-acetyl-D-mannosaminuronic acid dehydrogenase